MNFLIELLPLFVVRILANDCERIRLGGRIVAVPRPGVMIEVKEKPISGPVVLRLA